MDLFDYMRETEMKKESPLASRMRPETLEEVVGQKHIIGRDRLLYRAIKADKLGSVIFYGPPGTGKTTLARVIANTTSAAFEQINATTANPAELVRKAEQTVAELKEARRVIEQYKAKESAGGADELLKKAEDVGGLHVTVQKLTQGDANSLRQLGDMLRDKDPAVVAVLALVGEKVTFQAVCGKEAVARGVKAGDIIKTIAPICGGRGGGKPDSAMGGGSDLEKVDQALAQVKALVAAKV